MDHETIRSMIDFVNEGTVSESQKRIIEEIGQRNYRVVCIKILSWLKSRHNMTKKQSLLLNPKYTWVVNLSRIFEIDQEFKKLFQIKEKRLDFSDNISQEKQNFIRELSNKSYNPPLMMH